MLGWIVVAADFFVIIAFQIFSYVLEQGQENYVNQFREDTLEITDFAIRVKNVPHNMDYGDTDINLQAFLMTHFQQVIKDQWLRQYNQALPKIE